MTSNRKTPEGSLAKVVWDPEYELWAIRGERGTMDYAHTMAGAVLAALEQDGWQLSQVEEVKPSLGENIRSARKRMNWTMRQLCRETGIVASNMSAIETGKSTNPSITTVVRIANALGVTVDELLYGREGVEENTALPNGSAVLD